MRRALFRNRGYEESRPVHILVWNICGPGVFGEIHEERPHIRSAGLITAICNRIVYGRSW